MTEYEDQKVVLKSNVVNPFNQWSDWFGTNGEAVVTFTTIQHELYEEWERQCVTIEDAELVEQEDETTIFDTDDAKRIINHSKFGASELTGPGVYRDDTHYDDDEKVDESYSIIVPYPFLSPKLCREWIENLNEKFDRQFKLSIDEEQEEMAAENPEELEGIPTEGDR